MEKPIFKYRLYWLISALALSLLIFFGYSEIKYSGNKISLSVPGQKDTLKLDLPDYFLSNSAIPAKDNKKKDGSEETISQSYTLETKDILPDTSLFYLPRDISKQIESEDQKVDSGQEAATQSGGTNATVAVRNAANEKSLLPSIRDIFWMNVYMNISRDQNNSSSVTNSSPANKDNLNRVNYTSVGTGNHLERAKVNSINNTQRITQVGRNNYASYKLINTINSELTVHATGDFNSVTQKVFDASNARITAIQNGFLNRVRQEVVSNSVWGAFNRTVNEIKQNGYNNLFRTRQFGDSNTIYGLQNGSLNSVDISQQGSNNSATVRQSGSGNSVTIEQH